MSVILLIGGSKTFIRQQKKMAIKGQLQSECDKFIKSLERVKLNKCDYLKIDIGKEIFCSLLRYYYFRSKLDGKY